MAELNMSEKIVIERLLDMGGGYVLNFSDRTFRDFIFESVHINIDDTIYFENGGSKAKRFRTLLKKESNYTIGKLLTDLLEYYAAHYLKDGEPVGKDYDTCHKIATRLKNHSPVPNIEVITGKENDKDFQVLTESIREGIAKNQPEAELDRLHTFVFKFIRYLCEQHNITYTKEESLNAVFGKYVKHIIINGLVETVMGEKILKYSISVIEAFNDVRNNKSLAHENPLLNYDESILIFNNVVNAITYIQKIEAKYLEIKKATELKKIQEGASKLGDDLPF